MNTYRIKVVYDLNDSRDEVEMSVRGLDDTDIVIVAMSAVEEINPLAEFVSYEVLDVETPLS